MAAYYNEIDPAAAHLLRCLIKDGVIAPGDVDERSIKDVQPEDLRGYTQCHFFAGGGLWSVAARLAGWPDDRPLWTGSCPCQPFSVAGKGAAENDPRHLWPDFFRLISACRPPVVMGEQVAGKAGYGWLDGVRTDLAREGYASRGVDIPACSVDAPHIRSRLYWCAVADAVRAAGWQDPRSPSCNEEAHGRAGWDWSEQDSYHRPSSNGESNDCAVGDADAVWELQPQGSVGEQRRWVGDTGKIDMEHPACQSKGSLGSLQKGPQPEFAGGGCVDMADANSRRCSGRQEESQRGEEWRTAAQWVGCNGSFWSDHEWRASADGKKRRAQPGVRLLVDGFPNRVASLRIAGNAIVPQVAAEVMAAFMDAGGVDGSAI